MTIIYSRKYRKSSLLDTKRNLLRAAICIMMLLSISQYSSAQAGVWTWMNGTEAPNSPGSYGIKGVADPDNVPPARYQAAHWKDKDGNFWVFGGLNSALQGAFNDLWKFDPMENLWTWVSGPNTVNSPPVYGQKGIPSPLNLPPVLSYGAQAWYDGADGLYLYGGYSNIGFHSNMWKYSIAMNEWVWLTGSELVPDPEFAGIKGVSSPQNTPGGRAEEETCWAYDEKLWFTCGQNGDASVTSATWHFDLNTLEWTWVHGPLGVDPIGIKGTEKVYHVDNYPSSRFSWAKLSHQESAFVFSTNVINDFWQFNSDSLAWRLLGEGDSYPYFEEYCEFDTLNTPQSSPELQSAEVFSECRDYLFIYGGINVHDLWAYDLSEEQWTLVWGNPEDILPSNFGDKGVPSLDNVPPIIAGACMWSDSLGNLWVFSGVTNFSFASAMWRFEPDYSCLNLNDTSECCELTVTFRISNTMDSSGSVEIQVVDGQGIIEYSIDGGMTWSSENFFDDLPPGDYDIMVRDETGCFYTGKITILDIGVGTTNLENVDFSFSPNPVTDILNIEINQLNQTKDSRAQIRVIDMSGKVLLKSFPNIENSALQTKLSLLDLSQGSYFVQILIDDYYILQKISKI